MPLINYHIARDISPPRKNNVSCNDFMIAETNNVCVINPRYTFFNNCVFSKIGRHDYRRSIFAIIISM